MIGKKKQSDVLWVQGDPAEVLLIVSNPLALELKVEKMVRDFASLFFHVVSYFSLSIQI